MQIAVAGHDIAGLTLALRLRIKGHDVVVHERSTAVELADQFTVIAPMRDLFLKSGGALDDLVGIDAVDEPLTIAGVALPASGAQVPAIREALGADAARAWGLLLQQAAETWQAVRTDQHHARTSIRRTSRRLLNEPRLRSLFDATLPPVAHLSDAAVVFPYLRQAFGCWRFSGGMSGFENLLRERCEKVGVRFDASPAPDNAMTVDRHYQRMFVAPPHFVHRGPDQLTQRLGLPFIGMAAEAIAQRIGRA